MNSTVGFPQARGARPEDTEAILQLLCAAFGIAPDVARPLFYQDPFFDLSHKRLLVTPEDGIVSSLTVIPASMWVGDVQVPVAGIAGVATHPRYRRCGHASRLLTATIGALADELSYPIAALLPYSYGFYRQFGWATTSRAAVLTCPMACLPKNTEAVAVRPVRPDAGDDRQAIHRLHEIATRARTGACVRDSRRWRVIEDLTPSRHAAVYENRYGAVEGYLLFERPADEGAKSLIVQEMFGLTEAARRGLIGFLAGAEPADTELIWEASPDDLRSFGLFALMSLEQHQPQIALKPGLMMRLVDVASALVRIHPTHLAPVLRSRHATLTVRIADALRPENTRPVLLHASGVRPGSHADRDWVETEVSVLAQIYMGYLAPSEAATVGLLNASSQEALLLADRLFPPDSRSSRPSTSSEIGAGVRHPDGEPYGPMPRKNKQKITPRALMELKMPGDVRVALDGFRIAYTVSETDWDENRVTQHVHVTTTAADAEPRQVTRGLDGESEPRWSPDGRWLAFLTARDDDEATDDDYADDDPKQQVYLLPMDGMGGEAERLTVAPEGVADYDWLPDSSGIVYLARESRPKPLQAARDDKQDRKDDAVVEHWEKFRSQIWRIDREDKKAELVHPGDFGIGEIAVAPDGLSVAFTTNYTGEVNDYHKADLWTVAIETGAVRQLTDGPGGKYHPVWTRDGERLLFVRPIDPQLSYSQENLFAVPASGGPVVNLTQDFPHDVTGWQGVRQDAQGGLFILVALGTTTAIYRLSDDGFVPVVREEEHIHDFDVAPGGGIAFVASGTGDVPEVLWLGLGDKEPVALTDLNEDWFAQYGLAPTDPVAWRSFDGLEIEGLLTYPTDYTEGRAYPTIISLHGGPHGRSLQALSPYTVAQVYAAAGYVVLSPNYRGSEGYGNEFGIANRDDLGGGDYRDVMAGVDWLISEGVADPSRLAVTGASYGGFLTNWIIGHTDRFRAAVSEFGIFSLVTDFSQSQAPRWEVEYLNGHPWDRPDAYAAQSPATYLKNIATPILLLHGEGDGNTFIANSQEMYQSLRLLGKTVQYAHYPREGHGIGEPEHRLDELRRILNWFDQYVLGGGKRQTYRIGDKVMHDGWELTVAHATLATYAGRGNDKKRYVEVAFVLRDANEARRPLVLAPGDLSLTRTAKPGAQGARPVGLPIDVLGEKVLAEGSGWKFAFSPTAKDRSRNDPGLAVPVAVTFRIGQGAGEYQFAVKDFPPVTMDVPAPDKEEKSDEKKAAPSRP